MSGMPETPRRGGANPTPCTDYPINHFFPTSESKGGKPTAGEVAALQVCGRCPLASRGACLEEALRFPAPEQHGVVGGATSAQRRLIVRSRQAARAVESVLAEVA